MPQVRKIEDDVLTERIGRTFKDVGYEGASLAMIADVTGLKKSSLYHRFPDGKEQMANEVLASVVATLDAELFPTLEGDASVERKVASFVDVMDAVYASGRESCLLNMLCPPRGGTSVRGDAIAGIFRRLIDALAKVAEQAGSSANDARRRAEEALVTLQGSLVVARGVDDPAVFGRALSRLPAILTA